MTYSRAQVAYAVRIVTKQDDALLPKMKKLWELGIPIPQAERPGTGTAIGYSVANAVEVAIAIELNKAGLPLPVAADFVKRHRVAIAGRAESVSLGWGFVSVEARVRALAEYLEHVLDEAPAVRRGRP